MPAAPELIEVPPEECSRGHRLTYPNAAVGYRHCQCSGTSDGRRGHRTWTCLTCSEVILRGHHDVGDGELFVVEAHGRTHVRLA